MMPAASQVSDFVGWDDNDQTYFDLATGMELTAAEAADLNASYFLGGDNSGAAAATDDRAALAQAAAQAAAQVGIAGVANGDRTQEEEVAYIGAFKNIILSNPQHFSDATIAIAQNINLNRANYGYDVTQGGFALGVTNSIADAANAVFQSQPGAGAAQGITAAAAAARDALISFGKTVSNLAALAPYVLPIAFLGFLYFAIQSVGKDPAGQFSTAAQGGAKGVRALFK